MASHIMDFLDTNNILYDKQFGFRKSHSTSHAIITLVDKVSRALDTGKFIVGVFLDLKKAFDTVDHTILLKKLHAYGIRDNHLDWFKSYLNNRTQYVTYNNARSDIKTITHGVPQGSILGPLLFILYVNDFSRASSLLFSILFADDTSVFIEGECYTGVINILNKELNSICLWLKSNKLTLNVKKSHYMMYHRTRMEKITRDVIIENEKINEVKSFKFLDVIIDNKLTWQDHIYYIKNKIAKSMGIIYTIRKYVDRRTLINLYYSLVFPYLIYCNEVWGHANNIYTDSLVKLQKKIIRIIMHSYYNAHTEPLFRQLNILDFHKLVIQRTSLMMFKYSSNNLSSPIRTMFIRNNEIHNYNTRNRTTLHVPIGTTETTYATFRFHGIYIWNLISERIPTDVSYSCFKHILNIHIQTHELNYRLHT